MHSSGSVLASCSGERRYVDVKDDSSGVGTAQISDLESVTNDAFDNSLKIWAF